MSAARPARLTSRFTDFVAAAGGSGVPVVQPRMGFGSPAHMRAGLEAVRATGIPVVGTVTLDSYTRQGLHDQAGMAMESGVNLNGFPLVAMGARRTARMLEGLLAPGFPVQIRHGSPQPERIVETMLAAGVDATEGGPVSYCLPYSRVPLRTATRSWSRTASMLAEQAEHGTRCHIESFGGCMLGQLCPPSLLVALSVLECRFFAEHGVRSVSASYAQQTNAEQDAEALWALRRLCHELLPGMTWHIVLYTYMGLFPESPEGAHTLLVESARLAARTRTERLIVKTTAEAHRIPTIEENVDALLRAHRGARGQRVERPPEADTETYLQARALVEATMDLAPTMAEALPLAFEKGLLDVPYCPHPDNLNKTRSLVGPGGRLEWWDTGKLPLPTALGGGRRAEKIGADQLLSNLAYHRRRLDPVARAA